MSRLEVDEIWRELGKWGRYSKIKLGTLLFGIVPTVFQIFSYVFIGRYTYAFISRFKIIS